MCFPIILVCRTLWFLYMIKKSNKNMIFIFITPWACHFIYVGVKNNFENLKDIEHVSAKVRTPHGRLLRYLLGCQSWHGMLFWCSTMGSLLFGSHQFGYEKYESSRTIKFSLMILFYINILYIYVHVCKWYLYIWVDIKAICLSKRKDKNPIEFWHEK